MTNDRLSGPLADLVRRLERGECRSVSDAVRLLADTPLRPEHLARWADFAHPAADSYGRKLVFGGRGVELMVMSWSPGDASAIHDHGAAEWGAVKYLGVAEHMTFGLVRDDEPAPEPADLDEKPPAEGRLELRHHSTTELDSVLPVDQHLIHMMANPAPADGEGFLSVHLYCTAADTTAVTAGARIFNLWDDCVERTDGGVFYRLPDREVKTREAGPRATEQVRRIHHRHLRARLARMREAGEATAEDRALERAVADALAGQPRTERAARA